MRAFENSSNIIYFNNCKSEDLVKKFSVFNVGNKHKAIKTDPCVLAGCDAHNARKSTVT
jgi:ribosomal protein L15E